MKKLIAALLAGVLGLSMAACGNGASANPNLLMITDSGAGAYSAYGGEIASTLNAMLKSINITPSTTGDSVENVRLINKKGADIAILPSGLLDYAYQGIAVFEGDGRLENVSAIAALYPEVVYIVAAGESNIGGVTDLKGKRVSVGEAGSGTEANARRILEAHGLSFADLGKTENLDIGGSAAAFEQSAIDAAFVTVDTADVESLAFAELNGVHLVPVTGEAVNALIAKYPYYIKYTLPTDAFEGKAGFAGVETVAAPATLACRKDIDEETIYQVTKALFENKDNIAHEKAKALDPAASSKGLAVPLHPGADKYFKEAAAAQ